MTPVTVALLSPTTLILLARLLKTVVVMLPEDGVDVPELNIEELVWSSTLVVAAPGRRFRCKLKVEPC